MTGLPIVETKANDVSVFIPTNVISITDGQCFLESDLFNAGQRPALNVGISVSRVGGFAQHPAMKQIVGRLRVDLAQFRELEAFVAFGSDLDSASKAQLERGQRMVELLKQAQYQPMPTENQVVSVWAGTTGKMDDVPVADIRRFEAELLAYLRQSHSGLMTSIREGKKMSNDTLTAVADAIAEFKQQFETSDGKLLGADAPPPSTSRSDDGRDLLMERSSGSTSVASNPSPRRRRSPRRWR
ncbi:F0F1 ATP synthase subunit alpha [Streptomyces tanashiensis]